MLNHCLTAFHHNLFSELLRQNLTFLIPLNAILLLKFELQTSLVLSTNLLSKLLGQLSAQFSFNVSLDLVVDDEVLVLLIYEGFAGVDFLLGKSLENGISLLIVDDSYLVYVLSIRQKGVVARMEERRIRNSVYL